MKIQLFLTKLPVLAVFFVSNLIQRYPIVESTSTQKPTGQSVLHFLPSYLHQRTITTNMEKNFDEEGQGNIFRNFFSSIFGGSIKKEDKMKQIMPSPILKDLVLVGGGHSHVFTLKSFGMNPMENVQLTLISRDVMTPYSGMIPGYISGHYTHEECHIDLCKLARFAGARLIHGEVNHIDTENKLIHLKDGRPPLPYDVVSVDIGSSPKMMQSQTDTPSKNVTPVKPIDGFSARWDKITNRILNSTSDRPLTMVVVGGGAGGIELVLAMQYRIRNLLTENGKDPEFVQYKLLNRGSGLLAQHNEAVQKIFKRILKERNVEVMYEKDVFDSDIHEEGGVLKCRDGTEVPYDECIWCTQASCQHWLQGTALELDSEGFITVQDTLESTNTPDVFACGDCAHVLNHPRPKAGVFAVRQGPPLTDNLRRRLVGKALVPFTPQTTFLGLISTGDKYAVMSKGSIANEGQGLWQWKDEIDRNFMYTYSSKLPQMEAMMQTPATSAVAEVMGYQQGIRTIEESKMRCRGCGGKVGASALSRVISRLQVVDSDQVLSGLNSPDDAAIIQLPGNPNQVMIQTVDFLGSFCTDPYLFGKIAALHALSDVYAMGGTPATALATTLVPYALESKVESALDQVMSGANSVLTEAGCALVGGHTHESPELGLGLAITGFADKQKLLRKGGMKPGDKLILTKALGTGFICAAEMRAKAKGYWYLGAVRSMLLSNQQAGQILADASASCCTDVTGFGLVGHLHEMISASDGVAVELDLESLPELEGALDCNRMGITSSLFPKNRMRSEIISNSADWENHKLFPLLFDPQSSGGLLASVSEQNSQRCLEKLKEVYPDVTIVGSVVDMKDFQSQVSAPIRIV